MDSGSNCEGSNPSPTDIPKFYIIPKKENMNNRTKSKDGSIFVTDEIFNSSSHLAAAIFSLVGAVLLVVKSGVQGDVWKIVSFSIYGLTLVLLFLASSVHHGIVSTPKIESAFKLLDYFAIFPLIAGTFTPFCLVPLRGAIGWSIFGIIWGLAIAGITIKAIFPNIPKWTTNTIYVSMGWIGGILAVPLYKILGFFPIALLALGGVFYTVGSIIFYSERPNFVKGKFGFHELWHIFVILGALSHFIIMYVYILPYKN